MMMDGDRGSDPCSEWIPGWNAGFRSPLSVTVVLRQVGSLRLSDIGGQVCYLVWCICMV